VQAEGQLAGEQCALLISGRAEVVAAWRPTRALDLRTQRGPHSVRAATITRRKIQHIE
jgi:hypothetical protein